MIATLKAPAEITEPGTKGYNWNTPGTKTPLARRESWARGHYSEGSISLRYLNSMAAVTLKAPSDRGSTIACLGCTMNGLWKELGGR